MNWTNLFLRIFTISMIGFFAVFVSQGKLMLSFIPLIFSVIGTKKIMESSQSVEEAKR